MKVNWQKLYFIYFVGKENVRKLSLRVILVVNLGFRKHRISPKSEIKYVPKQINPNNEIKESKATV